MAKIKSKKKATPTAKKGSFMDERATVEMVMLLVVTLGLAVTTMMSFGR